MKSEGRGRANGSRSVSLSFARLATRFRPLVVVVVAAVVALPSFPKKSFHQQHQPRRRYTERLARDTGRVCVLVLFTRPLRQKREREREKFSAAVCLAKTVIETTCSAAMKAESGPFSLSCMLPSLAHSLLLFPSHKPTLAHTLPPSRHRLPPPFP